MDSSTDFSAALLELSVTALEVVAGWALIVILLNSWRPTARVAHALTPPALRFLLAASLSGVVVNGGVAYATDIDGLPLPERPVSATTQHVVQPGDSLWSIAASSLADPRHVGTVAQQTQRWYDMNRETIGADPDLIQPGQRLVAPDAEEGW